MPKLKANGVVEGVVGKVSKASARASKHAALSASRAASKIRQGLNKDLFGGLNLAEVKKLNFPIAVAGNGKPNLPAIRGGIGEPHLPVRVSVGETLPTVRTSSQLIPLKDIVRKMKALPSNNASVEVIYARPNMPKESPFAQLKKYATDAEIVEPSLPAIRNGVGKPNSLNELAELEEMERFARLSRLRNDMLLDDYNRRIFNDGLWMTGASIALGAGALANLLNTSYTNYKNRKQEIANPKLLGFDDTSKYIQSSDGSIYDKESGKIVGKVNKVPGDNIFESFQNIYGLHNPEQIKQVQRELGVDDDGIVGLQTVNALRKKRALEAANNYSFWDYLTD